MNIRNLRKHLNRYPEWVIEQVVLAAQDGDVTSLDDAIDFAEYCVETGPVDPEERVWLTEKGMLVAEEFRCRKSTAQ